MFGATDMIASIDQFIAKVMAGIELTATYTVSFGNNYPPIDEDVTFWCLLPWVKIVFIFNNYSHSEQHK